MLAANARRGVLQLLAILICATAVVSAATFVGRFFVWNLSPSLPHGSTSWSAPKRLPVARSFPSNRHPAAAFIATRGYLPAGGSLLKVVVALPGDAACVDDGRSPRTVV